MTFEVASPPRADGRPEGCPHVLDPTGSVLHAEADELRAQGPTQVELPGGVLAWSLNSHDTVRAVLTDPRVTKSARAHWRAFREGRVPPDWELISWVAMDNMVTSYGRDHIRLRRLVTNAFTPRRTESMRPRMEELVDTLLTSLAQEGPDQVVDLRERFAYPLPARVVADMIGMDEHARREAAAIVDLMVDTTVSPEQAQRTLAGWRGAMAALIDEKRRRPGADITSDLLAAQDEDGSRLTDQELTDTVFAILGAGSETTINFLDNAITALLEHPEQLTGVVTGTYSWDDVIDETLRVHSPLAHLPLRYAAEDIEVAGVHIPRGDPILVNYAAVGRDPALHGPDAGAFDLARPDKTHLSFGVGPHYCLGAGVARTLARTALSTLVTRFPDMRLAADPQPLPTFIMNGHRELLVTLGREFSGPPGGNRRR